MPDNPHPTGTPEPSPREEAAAKALHDHWSTGALGLWATCAPAVKERFRDAARAVLTAAFPNDESGDKARTEQELENEQVRRLQQTGRCPVCGADA